MEGFTLDTYTLGMKYKNKNDTLHYMLIKEAAEQGHVTSIAMMSGFCATGFGETRNSRNAFRWCSKAVDKGCIISRYNLAYYYINGFGIPKNYEQAVYWYQKAIDGGCSQAYEALSKLYETGAGDGIIKKDVNKAIEILQCAVNCGNIQYASKLDKLLYETIKNTNNNTNNTNTDKSNDNTNKSLYSVDLKELANENKKHKHMTLHDLRKGKI
jgi:TPR repeat protein